MARMYDLRQKEVINTEDGARYGYVSDLEIDEKTGKVRTLIVPAPGRVLGVFGRDQEYRIPWQAIQKIGDDIVLVECKTEEVLSDSEAE
ncbi:MAG: YlmC/YmxH family sporulation protein [Clostridiales bacterium]|jgi:YlmC/YmxH family sporulation protein|nr:YlmC/YmxH family sporulation protein [Clostridiales bacterium]